MSRPRHRRRRHRRRLADWVTRLRRHRRHGARISIRHLWEFTGWWIHTILMLILIVFKILDLTGHL